jgi:hypothetical protein
LKPTEELGAIHQYGHCAGSLSKWLAIAAHGRECKRTVAKHTVTELSLGRGRGIMIAIAASKSTFGAAH